MKKYYCVTTCFYDDGHCTAAITSAREADTAPENTRMSARECDIYVDWFDTRKAAQEFVQQAKEA